MFEVINQAWLLTITSPTTACSPTVKAREIHSATPAACTVRHILLLLHFLTERVPVPVVSIVDLTVTLERDVTVEEVNNAFREAAAAGPLKGILGYSDEPLVSSDYQGDPRSSIIDGLSTLVIGGNMVKILAWYDNEWGFSNRLVDLALMMAKRES